MKTATAEMARNQGLMCVWQALSSQNPSLQGLPGKQALRKLTSLFCSLPQARASENVFEDVFRNDDFINQEQYCAFVSEHLLDPQYAMCLLEDEIEQVCWDLCKEQLQGKGFDTDQMLKQMWQIFGRLCEWGSMPPVIRSNELDWLQDKIQTGVSLTTATSTGTPSTTPPMPPQTFLGVLDLLGFKEMQESENSGSQEKAINEIHMWLVREVLMTGWMYKRTRKQANWTSWLKRWFVLTPGQLAYYDGSKLKVCKGSIDITKTSIITDLPDARRFGWKLTGCLGLENRPSLQLEMSTMDKTEKKAWMAALLEVQRAVEEGSTPVKRVLSKRRRSDAKNNLLMNIVRDLPFISPKTQPQEPQHKKHRCVKGSSVMCNGCNQGIIKRDHISIKQPRNRSKLKKMISVPEDQKVKIRAIFFSIDKDGNGKIDPDEFQQFLEKLGLQMSRREVEIIFEGIPEKQDGKITMEGFYTYFVRTILNVTSGTCAEGRLRTAFLNADREQTGTINFREFVEYVWEKRRSMRISRVLNTFKSMDKDEDGEVDLNDFMNFMRHDPSFATELSITKCRDGRTEITEEEEKSNSDSNNDSNTDDMLDLELSEELQEVLCDEEKLEDPKAMMDYLRQRWVRFTSFKRPGASGAIVMKGKSNLVSDVLPGEYSLLDLAAFSDLPPLIPRHAHLQNVVWEEADPSNCDSHGRVIFPADFDGVLPVEVATTELLRYYGCSLANAATMKVSLIYRHAIQDFTYENQYISEYVANPEKQAGAGMEKHDFSHLDMPLDDAGGYMVLAKMTEDGEMNLTAFSVPTRHCLYLPGGTLHTNDYLKGTWRTMLSDEAPIDHCHITRRSSTAEGGLEKFIFTFK